MGGVEGYCEWEVKRGIVNESKKTREVEGYCE